MEEELRQSQLKLSDKIKRIYTNEPNGAANEFTGVDYIELTDENIKLIRHIEKLKHDIWNDKFFEALQKLDNNTSRFIYISLSKEDFQSLFPRINLTKSTEWELVVFKEKEKYRIVWEYLEGEESEQALEQIVEDKSKVFQIFTNFRPREVKAWIDD